MASELGRVTKLWRYAVKGLERDELTTVQLKTDNGFPNDRRFAFQFDVEASENARHAAFNSDSPAWVYKGSFMCAFTKIEALAQYVTRFDDDTETLTVRKRGNSKVLLEACLTEPSGKADAEMFFSVLAQQPVDLVYGSEEHKDHHFGNTPAGFKHHESGSIVHIVNAQTARALSKAANIQPPLEPWRFRPNIVIDDVEAWEEFNWIGQTVKIGGVEFEVVARTIRCEATNVDAQFGSGKVDLDVPGIIKKHSPKGDAYFGVYARVAKGGIITPGDNVRYPSSGAKKAVKAAPGAKEAVKSSSGAKAAVKTSPGAKKAKKRSQSSAKKAVKPTSSTSRSSSSPSLGQVIWSKVMPNTGNSTLDALAMVLLVLALLMAILKNIAPKREDAGIESSAELH